MKSHAVSGTNSACSTEDHSEGRARLIIADDHQELREVVVRLLEPDFEIVATAGDGVTLLHAVNTLKPDLLVLDISMPFLTGIEVARRLKAGGSNVKVVFLTVLEDSDFVHEAFEAGGSAYVVKSRLTTDLRQAINEVLAGHTFISPPLTLN
jgi:DNA-binding NarL/FixJ family response regulator